MRSYTLVDKCYLSNLDVLIKDRLTIGTHIIYKVHILDNVNFINNHMKYIILVLLFDVDLGKNRYLMPVWKRNILCLSSIQQITKCFLHHVL